MTKQKNSDLEIRLLKENKILSTIVNMLPDHLYWKDSDGVHLGCNIAAANFFGFQSIEEYIGKSDYDIATKAEAEKYIEADKSVMGSKKAKTLEESIIIDGEKKYFLSTKAPIINEIGVVTGILGVSKDITDRKKAQQLEKELELEKQAKEMLKLWSSAIAHEMRTPLLSFSSYILALKQKLDFLAEDMNKEKELCDLRVIAEKLEKIVKTANHYIDMTLMKAKAPEHKLEFPLQQLSVKEVVCKAISEYPFLNKDESLVTLDLTNDFIFMGDYEYFKHIIFNLIKNAIFYVKKSRKGKVEIKATSRKKENVLIFQDTGLGISKEDLQSLFTPFFSKTRHGTGVGLALCRNIMNSFHGEITCDSVEGNILSFSLFFLKFR